MFTTHFYDDKIDDAAVSYLVLKIIIQHGFFWVKNVTTKTCLLGFICNTKET